MIERSKKEPEYRQILRYWLAAVRQEESLAARPRPNLAQNAAQSPSRKAPNLLEPGHGQPYFRVGAEQAAFLTGKTATINLALDDARFRFFERWLRASYREESRAARTGGTRTTSFVTGWPTVHLVRKDELATLFRFPVDLVFRTAGRAFKTPTREDRRAKRAPAAPNELVVHNLTGSEGGAPFSIDLQLLSHTLGVQDETIDRLCAEWADKPPSASRMISEVLKLLDPEGTIEESPEAIFKAIVDAASRRAPEGAKVYPTAIVQDGALSQTTFHLQRELAELVRDAPIAQGTPLHAYLTGKPGEVRSRELKGRIAQRGLTKSQREAAEHALGTTLAAVCGPPGTGKTELILNLAAHTIVERAESLAKLGSMSFEPLVIASTNNRAVDNAIDPLAERGDRLPLALRTGSQDVTASVTKEQLVRALTWLEAQSEDEPLVALNDALGAFKIARRAWIAAVKPNRRKRKREAELAESRRALAELEPEGASAGAIDQQHVAALEELENGLMKLLDVLDEEGKGHLKRIERAWAHFESEQLAKAKRRGLEAAARVAAILPPERSASVEAWSEAIDAALVHLEQELSPVQAAKRREREKDDRAQLEKKIAKLEARIRAMPEESAEAPAHEAEPLAHALFLSALDVREKWAIQNRAALILALKKTIEAAEQRSLRRFLEKDRAARAKIFALYPIVGCTLLSLGNVFPDTANSIARLVIDEAGQCHPAYAVSGLLRARRALLIGDVNQLTPVIQMGELEEARAQRTAKLTIDRERFEVFRVFDRSPVSAQSLADRADPARRTLIDHFRCQPEIIAISDALCGYGLIVHTPRRSYAERVPWLSSPVIVEDVRSGQQSMRGSWANRGEAERAFAIVLDLLKHGVDPESIAVLTPYVGQLELLRTLFRPVRLEDALALGTVHRFQGGERDIAILSTVISEPRSLGFLNERPNLLNVAVSRARDHFVLLGNLPVLAQGRLTRHLLGSVEHDASRVGKS